MSRQSEKHTVRMRHGCDDMSAEPNLSHACAHVKQSTRAHCMKNGRVRCGVHSKRVNGEKGKRVNG